MNAPSLPFLILEDEPFIALDLKLAFEDNGWTAEVAATCAEALAILADAGIRGAVLDVNLGHGETCWPIVERLDEMRIPYLLHTGDLNREGERIQSIKAPVVAKPAIADVVVERLVRMIAASER